MGWAWVAVEAAVGWFVFSSLALATGAVTCRWLILPPRRTVEPAPARRGSREPGRGWSEEEWNEAELEGRTARIGWWGAVALAVALLLVLARQLVDFRDPFEPWGAEARLLLGGTPWGTRWLMAGGGAVVAVVGLHLAARQVRGAWPVATLAVLALGAYPALSGHAAGGALRWLTIPADTLHVWAAGTWMGGLALVLLLERGARRHRERAMTGDETAIPAEDPEASSLLPVLVRRFSRVAIAAVATLAVTGAFASWLHVGSLGGLAATPYGRLLLLKLLLVMMVLGLGALNFRVLAPRLGSAGGAEALRRAAWVELVLANVVLAVTAVLVRTPQP